MANYLFAVANRSEMLEVSGLVGDGAITPSFGSDHVHLFWSKETDNRPSEAAFVGYAVDHYRGQLRFGSPFGSQPLNHAEGCYFQAIVEDGHAALSADAFAQMPMFYYADDKRVIVSDSVLLVSMAMAKVGIEITLNEEVLKARAWRNAMADQLLSTRTPVSKVTFCPPGTTISLKAVGGAIEADVKTTPHREFFSLRGKSYAEGVRLIAARAASMARTLMSIEGGTFLMGLSGGQDSRSVFAAMLSAGSGTVRVNSNTSMSKDFAVASDIASKFGVTLNDANLTGGSSVRMDAMAYWFMHNAGVYDPIYTRPSLYFKPLVFDAGGHGAEVYKGNYGWRPLSLLLKDVPPSLRDEFAYECETGLSACGIDPSDPVAAEWHYLGFRNAIHSSRFTMLGTNGIRPLMQREIVALSRMGEGGAKMPIASDILILLNADLAGMPFDKPHKDLNRDYINERLTALGGPIGGDEVRQYEIVGSLEPQRAFHQASHLILRCAARGLSGAASYENLVRLAKEACERIPAGLVTIYAPMIDAFIEEPRANGSDEARQIGKALSLLLLN